MPDTAPVIKLIPVNRILPSRHQARKSFNEESLKNLAASIKKEGLVEPIMVRVVPPPEGVAADPVRDTSAGLSGQSNDKQDSAGTSGQPSEGAAALERPISNGAGSEWYEIIFGERRWRAYMLLGRETIEAIITTVASEAASAAKGLVENLQREGINPIEEAEGFVHLNQLDPVYWTQGNISETVGRSHGYISQSLKMLKLPQSIIDNVRRLTIHRSNALELLRLPNEGLQETAANEIVAKDLNLKNTRTLIDKMIENQVNRAKTQAGEQAGGATAGAHPSNDFSIKDSAGAIHIIGSFQKPIVPAEVIKALEATLLHWQEMDSQPKNQTKQPKHPKSQQTSKEPKAPDQGAPITPSPLVGKAEANTAGQPLNMDQLKKALESEQGNLINGQAGQAVLAALEYQKKVTELISLQQALKAAGSEEEKIRLNAEIEKKKAEIEAIKKGLQAGGSNSAPHDLPDAPKA